jgi:hypothetical protein
MISGLGPLRRTILEALVPSKRLHGIGALSYRGGNVTGVVYHGHRVELEEGSFDVRAAKALLLKMPGVVSRQQHQTSAAFDVTFSRTVRALIDRGVLKQASFPLCMQRRFVSCPGGAPKDVTVPGLVQAIARAEAERSVQTAHAKTERAPLSRPKRVRELL